jgi:hypothetical protein
LRRGTERFKKLTDAPVPVEKRKMKKMDAK